MKKYAIRLLVMTVIPACPSLSNASLEKWRAP